MKPHTDFQFLRCLADERERFGFPDEFNWKVTKQIRAIADQIERLSNTDMQLTAFVSGTCMHPIVYKGPHVAVGHVIPCNQCAGPTVVADVRCVTIDPPVT